MTTTLQQRLQAFETKHKHDEETNFYIHAKAARKLGAWAARSMRMNDDQVDCFVHNEVFDYLARRGMGHVMQFVAVKMKESGVHISDYVLNRQKDRFLKDARIEAMQMEHHPMAARH